MSCDNLSSLIALAHELRDCLTKDLADPRSERWQAHALWYAERTGMNDPARFADAVAQAIACARFALQAFASQLSRAPAVAWLIADADPLVSDVIRVAQRGTADGDRLTTAAATIGRIGQLLDPTRVASLLQRLPARRTESDASVYFYEQFLADYDRNSRRRKGVFYTPHPLVAFVVRSIDAALRAEFSLPDGLADQRTWSDVLSTTECGAADTLEWAELPFIHILDPAMGTGAFLLETWAVARERFHDGAARSNHGPAAVIDLWNEFVSSCLLPTIRGHELMLPPLVLAHIATAAWLAESGYRFAQPGRLRYFLADTLLHPEIPPDSNAAPTRPVTVVLGNPPFSGISENKQRWLRNLMRGQDPRGDRRVADYFSANGEPLGERKHWLEDDYVKFMRFAHWQIETAGAGIVGLVTNHGYLDNSTFRGLRESLLNDFPHLSVVDLHGNSRSGERRPDGGPDESVFGIEQGVAVGLFRRPPGTHATRSVRHAALWGDAASKLRALASDRPLSLPSTRLEPRPPHFFLAPRSDQRSREYEAGHRLCDIMPVNSTAVVTARDSFVIAFDEDQLHERMCEFASPDVADNEIRRKYFLSTRSSKYEAGDTRGWRVTEARQRLRAEPQWEQHIRGCLYRPFDRRAIFWTSWMIDWPRTNVMRHLVSPGNLALIARRQTPPGQPCCYFWVSDAIAVDGVIRSDNRGSESVFPLFLSSPARKGQPARFQPNFSDAFVHYCETRLGMAWQSAASEDQRPSLSPHQLFCYIYALFHCPSYRQRFNQLLRVDFPRVLVPRTPKLFHALARLGELLVQAHLLNSSQPSIPLREDPPGKEAGMIKRGYPRYSDETIWISKHIGFAPVEQAVWDYRVGTYQVCRKWLRDRRNRELLPSELQRYGQILHAIRLTIRTAAALDRQIKCYGGWEEAF